MKHAAVRVLAVWAVLILALVLCPAFATADDGSPLDAVAEPKPVVMHLVPGRGVPVHIPARIAAAEQAEAASAMFSITYLPAGAPDGQGATCADWEPAAQAAFTAAANTWATLISTATPIRINACWADLGGGSTLGYAWSYLRRDFANAPVARTWYVYALADALAGYDLDASRPDFNITYNTGFNWYFGTNGQPAANQVDFMSVVMHEMGHGLNFAGSMGITNGLGSWGYGTGYPNIYDRFVRNAAGQSLISTIYFPNSSVTLATQLTGGNLYFTGPNTKGANGNANARIYAPSRWAPGSSYSHWDYTTFNDTPNELMVYAISPGESIHDPGPVGINLLKDVGWRINETPVAIPDTYETDEDTVLATTTSVLANDQGFNGTAPLTAEKRSDPEHGALAFSSDGFFTYTPAPDWWGVDHFTYRISNGSAWSADVTVGLHVNPVNDAPVAAGDRYSMTANTQLTVPAPGVLANDADIDDDVLIATLIAPPARGALFFPNGFTEGGFEYLPAAGWTGTDSFTYQVSDAHGGAGNIATVTVEVTTPPPALSGLAPASATAGGAGLVLTVTGANFVDGATVQWNGAERPTAFAGATELTATIPASDLAAAGVAYVKVIHPGADGLASGEKAFYITQTGAGVSVSDTATGVDPSATTGAVTATGVGTGTISVAEYGANPGGEPTFPSADAFIDVHVAPGSSLAQLTVVDCHLNGGMTLHWWNGTAWAPASDQRYDAATGCVTVLIDDATSPSLGEMTGAPFAAAHTAAALTLTVSASPATYSAAGQVIMYAYKAVNAGQGAVDGPFFVSDDQLGTFQCGTATSLAPGASLSCTRGYTVKEADVSPTYDAAITDVATVAGSYLGAPVTSAAAGATVNQVAPTARVTVSSASCAQFAAGSAMELKDAFYTVSASRIKSVVPNVFMYWSQVTAPATSFQVVVQQSNPQGWVNLGFRVPQFGFYNSMCQAAATSTTLSLGRVTLRVTRATPGAKYYVYVRYGLDVLVGKPAAAPYPAVPYRFVTSVNGGEVLTSWDTMTVKWK